MRDRATGLKRQTRRARNSSLYFFGAAIQQTPFLSPGRNPSWLNRIEAQFTGLRYFALDGTDHPDHATQGRMIRRYIAWRNRHANDQRLRRVLDRANRA